MFLIIEKRMILSTYKQLLNHNLMYHVSYKHTTWKKNDGVNSFLVTVWLSMIVRSLRRRKKNSAATSRLTHNDCIPWKQVNPYWTVLLSRRRKPEWVSTFATHCMNVNIVKGLNRWMELSSFIHISYRHDGLDAHTLYVFRFLSWKERWMFTISRGMTS